MKLLVWGTGLLSERFMSTVKEEVIGFVSKDEPTKQFQEKYILKKNLGGGGREQNPLLSRRNKGKEL